MEGFVSEEKDLPLDSGRTEAKSWEHEFLVNWSLFRTLDDVT